MILPLFVSLALAVEGMWEPSQLPALGPQLASAGFVGDPSRLAEVGSAPLGAIASLGGCTASFVSESGLLVTNHHCVTGMLQRAQKPGENLLDTGFYAPSRAEERSAGAGTRVFVTQDMVDVTQGVVGSLGPKLGDRERTDAIEAKVKRLVATCEAPGGLRCRVASTYEGLRYSLIRQVELRDVRVVMAPPEMVGNYGDEVDNWHWPRHTGDFSFIRAYVGPDGKPADFSANNVPYVPAHHLTVSPRGVDPGGFVLLAGYPGTTRRWRTALEVDQQGTRGLPSQVEHGGWVFDLLTSAMAADPASASILGVPRLGLGNGVFRSKAMIEGFARGDVVGRARSRDAALDAWVAADPVRSARWSAPIAELRLTLSKREATWQRDELMGYLGRSDLLSAARSLYRWSIERPRPDAKREQGYQVRDVPGARARFTDMQASLHLATDHAVFEHFLRLVLALPLAEQPAELRSWLEVTTPLAAGNVDALVKGALARLYTHPELAEAPARLARFADTQKTLESASDGFLSLAVALRPYDLAREEEGKLDGGAYSRLRPAYAEALRTFDAARAYPDANGTLRVTFGTVKGYSPRDAVEYGSQTTLGGLVEKAGPWPFAAPLPLLAAIEAGRWGPYGDAALGSVPVDFLSDLDITGGNSGSPTLNAEGQLVGLAFDSSYEGLASNWAFEERFSRSVHVDVRYMLWYLDAVAQADGLLVEMGIAPSI